MIAKALRFPVGVSLVLGLIWTSAAVGDGPLSPGAQYAAGDGPYSVAIGDQDGDQALDLPGERECGTVVTEQGREVMLRQAAAGAYELGGGRRAIVYVPLTFHVVRTRGGTGGLPADQICQALDDLDTPYLPAEMQFYLAGPIDYIDDDGFYYNIDTMDEIDALRSANPVAGTINLYFTPHLANENGEFCGISSFTWSPVQGIVMHNDCTGVWWNHTTLPHEMGHYFDLLHTHETAFGAECVDGSNCPVAGDLLCDTPADPNLSGNVNPSCRYTGTAADPCNNDPYNPDPTNLLSYSPVECRDNFTDRQDARTLATLTNLRPELMHDSLPGPADCNGNGIRDDCDIVSGTSEDSNANGVPDECEQEVPTVSEWGLIVMTALLVTLGTIIFGRRQPRAA